MQTNKTSIADGALQLLVRATNSECLVYGICCTDYDMQVYSGGIGSYALLVMVAAFLLLHPSRADSNGDGASQLEGNLGVLLLDFLRLYGRSLNVGDVGVSCR